MSRRIVRWLIFGVVLALVPLAVSWIFRSTRGLPINLEILLFHGELLLIAAALSAAAVGELFGAGTKRPILEILAGGACIILLLFAALYFADLSAAHAAKQTLQAGVVKTTSLVLYASSLVASGSCVALSEA